MTREEQLRQKLSEIHEAYLKLGRLILDELVVIDASKPSTHVIPSYAYLPPQLQGHIEARKQQLRTEPSPAIVNARIVGYDEMDEECKRVWDRHMETQRRIFGQ
jgi:hypothetical protein